MSFFENNFGCETKYKDLVAKTLVEIPKPDMKKLQFYHEECGFLPKEIFEQSQEVFPAGLNLSIIKEWLSQEKPVADPEHLKWVLKRCREMEKFSPR